ncbi:MAG: GNAT family N-acetyltransferase [Tepidiformaceae bacterium]
MNPDIVDDAVFALLPPGAGDRDVLAGVINAAFAVYPFMSGERTSAEGIEEEQGDTGRFVVASTRGEVAACAMIRPSLDVHAEPDLIEAEGDAATMYLGLVAVRPSIRKLGLGRRVVAAAEQASRDLGFSHVTLGTLREMGNVEYYEPLGYRVTGEQVFEPGHWGLTVPHHFCVMVKAL